MATIVRTRNSSFNVIWESDRIFFLKELRSVLSKTKIYPTDVTLACQGQFYQAHKLLLSVCSLYFRDVVEKHLSEFPNAVIVLADVSANSLNYILKFLYEGQVVIKQEEADKFFKAADILKIQGLMKKDVTFKNQQEKRPNLIEDLFGDNLYCKPPATPGRSLGYTEKVTDFKSKENHALSSTIHRHVDSNYQHKRFPDNKLMIQTNKPGKADDTKVKVSKSEFGKTTVEKVSFKNEEIMKSKLQKSNNNGSDSDNDSSANLFKCDDDYISTTDNESCIEDMEEEPEVVVIEDEEEMEQRKPECQSTSERQSSSSTSTNLNVLLCRKTDLPQKSFLSRNNEKHERYESVNTDPSKRTKTKKKDNVMTPIVQNDLDDPTSGNYKDDPCYTELLKPVDKKGTLVMSTNVSKGNKKRKMK